MKTRLKLIVMLSMFVASLMVSAFSMVATAQAKGTETRITLAGSTRFPKAKGTAKYKVSGTEREFQVEVENVKALIGKRLSVYVNSQKVGSFVVNSLGAGRLVLRGTAAPAIRPGVIIRVKTATGILVVAGKF
jgi:hypothetical protein